MSANHEEHVSQVNRRRLHFHDDLVFGRNGYWLFQESKLDIAVGSQCLCQYNGVITHKISQACQPAVGTGS